VTPTRPAAASAGRTYKIAVIPGDGVGGEVTPEAVAVLGSVAASEGFRVDTAELPWGSGFYGRYGEMMPADALATLEAFDAILLGAVGSPSLPDHVPVWGLVLPIRQAFEQYVNLRPMRLLPGAATPLAGRRPEEVDMVCVRENSEGEYCGRGRRLERGGVTEGAEETAMFTRRGIERVARFAFELASERPRRRLASATKSNALRHSMVLWDEVVEEVAAEYPTVEVGRYHVDALAARMVNHPDTLDTIVASNLFGDILTDLGAAITGSLGLAPSANLNPRREHPSMFEPIHGSAPDIAGRGIANPIGAIWAGAMMLDHLGERTAHDRIVAAIETVVAAGQVQTPDLGGDATTKELAAAIGEAL
jgi:tartrate dehydrogenase/decarboxylase/D-malate dehydrogenase